MSPIYVNGVEQALGNGVAIASGSYTGNDTDNRAIAHGLGATPKLVLIGRIGGLDGGLVTDTRNANHGTNTNVAVTGWDSTYFYVSNTTVIFNNSGVTYNWVAFA